MTPLTIVYAVIQWSDQSQRLPRARELCPAHGLPHWTTVYKVGFSSMSALFHAVSGVHEATTSSLAWLWQHEHKRCVRCDQPTHTPRDLCIRCAEVHGGDPQLVPTPPVPPGLQERSTFYRRLAKGAPNDA